MKNNIIKVPSYLIDMVVLENKKLMLMNGDITISVIDSKNIKDRISFAEKTEYKGRLFGKEISYHLIHINALKTSKANCKVNC